jgi:hypothetical protein
MYLKNAIAAASLSGLALCTTTTASFANSELQPGITTGIPLGAPLPPGVFLVDLPNYGYRDATPVKVSARWSPPGSYGPRHAAERAAEAFRLA